MKKLFHLDEQEKNRILNLHESSKRKEYLVSEQSNSSNDDYAAEYDRRFTLNFQNNSNWKKGDINQLKSRFPELTENDLYNCFTNECWNGCFKGFKQKRMGDDGWVYTNGNKIYYNNGLLYDYDSSYYKFYTCQDGTIQESDNPIQNQDVKSMDTPVSQPTTPQYSPSGGIRITRQITPEIVKSLRQSAGLTGTGNSLTQQDINDLYTKIYSLPNKQ